VAIRRVHLHLGNNFVTSDGRKYLALSIAIAIVEGDELDAVAASLKMDTIQQRADVLLQPPVGSLRRAIVCIVL
jgi:hypothetical protein